VLALALAQPKRRRAGEKARTQISIAKRQKTEFLLARLPPMEMIIPKHTNASSRGRLEVGLEAKRYCVWGVEDGRGVAMRGNHTDREIEYLKFARCGQDCQEDGRGRSVTQRRRLYKKGMHCRHGLAAILATVTVGRARH
jgi:hypothetical protein